MIYGEINLGFKNTLEVFILEAVADIWHGYVVLFSLFLSYVPAVVFVFVDTEEAFPSHTLLIYSVSLPWLCKHTEASSV